jgi:rhamnosyltransferase
MPHYSIGIVIPTFQAAKHLPHCLPPLLQSPLKPQILIIDSSSDDGTETLASRYGVETVVIPQQAFNHGATREKGRQHLKTEIVIMMTQDAYATSENTLQKLVEPLFQQKASIAYARQIPHVGADFFESFPRFFNYPASGHIRGIEDIKHYGVYTFFCSNSCAAYLNQALDEIKGFPKVPFGEDTLVTAQLLHQGHKIAYVAEAEVRHSHSYSILQEFSRHFEIGLVRQSYAHLMEISGTDSQRGKAYFKAMLQELRKKNPFLIPYAFLQTAAKWTGYQIGKKSVHAPIWLKKIFSHHQL